MYKFWKRDPDIVELRFNMKILREELSELKRESFMVAVDKDPGPDDYFTYEKVVLSKVLYGIIDHLGLELEFVPEQPKVKASGRLVKKPKEKK